MCFFNIWFTFNRFSCLPQMRSLWLRFVLFGARGTGTGGCSSTCTHPHHQEQLTVTHLEGDLWRVHRAGVQTTAARVRVPIWDSGPLGFPRHGYGGGGDMDIVCCRLFGDEVNCGHGDGPALSSTTPRQHASCCRYWVYRCQICPTNWWIGTALGKS